MKISQFKNILIASLAMTFACADNDLNVAPEDQSFPLQIVLDEDEGGDLPDAEDYEIEVTFADYTGLLPNKTTILFYEIVELEGDMEGNVKIDNVFYEYKDNDCLFEREIDFTSFDDGLSGSIKIAPDTDLGSVPENFKIILTLPGNENSEGSFVFKLTSINTSDNVILGPVTEFEYHVLDTDVSGEWELEIEDEEGFKKFKRIFAPISPGIAQLQFDDITGKIAFEFEYNEMQMEIELAEEEEVLNCEDGVTEIETENKIIEFEADYEAEDNELIVEGSHEIIGEDGKAEDEIDFVLKAIYNINDNGELNLSVKHVIDEDNFKDGEELFNDDQSIVFTLTKD